jgi:hypothetical protein
VTGEGAAKVRESKERETRERAAKERESKEREARERAAKERESKERETRERAAKERESKEREAKERASKERESKEREARDRAAKERESKEREAKERASKERESKEREARDRAAKERESKEREAKERAAKERESKEREARDRAAKERESKEREARDRAAKEREARERAAKERESKEREAKEQKANPAFVAQTSYTSSTKVAEKVAKEATKKLHVETNDTYYLREILRNTSRHVKLFLIINERILDSYEVRELLQRGAEIWITDRAIDKNKIIADDRIVGIDRVFYSKTNKYSDRDWRLVKDRSRKYEPSVQNSIQNTEWELVWPHQVTVGETRGWPHHDAVREAWSTLYVQTDSAGDLYNISKNVRKNVKMKIIVSISAAKKSSQLRSLANRGAEIWVDKLYTGSGTRVVADGIYVGDSKKKLFAKDERLAEEYIRQWKRRLGSHNVIPCR